MPRYNIDRVLNPYQNNLDQVQRELNAYKQKFEVENHELESLKKQHDNLKAQSMYVEQPDLN